MHVRLVYTRTGVLLSLFYSDFHCSGLLLGGLFPMKGKGILRFVHVANGFQAGQVFRTGLACGNACRSYACCVVGRLLGPYCCVFFVRRSPREDPSGWRVPAFRRSRFNFYSIFFFLLERDSACVNRARTPWTDPCISMRLVHGRRVLQPSGRRALAASRNKRASIEAHVNKLAPPRRHNMFVGAASKTITPIGICICGCVALCGLG